MTSTFDPHASPLSTAGLAPLRPHGFHSACHPDSQTSNASSSTMPGERIQATSTFTKEGYCHSTQGPRLPLMVDTRLQFLSGQTFLGSPTIKDSHHGLIPNRLGCSSQWHGSARAVSSRGISAPHQCFGTQGYPPVPSLVPPLPSGLLGGHHVRQHNSHQLHQSTRRDCLPLPLQTCHRPLGILPQAQHSPIGMFPALTTLWKMH